MANCSTCTDFFQTEEALHAHCRDKADHPYCTPCERLFVTFDALDEVRFFQPRKVYPHSQSHFISTCDEPRFIKTAMIIKMATRAMKVMKAMRLMKSMKSMNLMKSMTLMMTLMKAMKTRRARGARRTRKARKVMKAREAMEAMKGVKATKGWRREENAIHAIATLPTKRPLSST